MPDLPKIKPKNLAKLINYQKSSVVSREIINKKTGTVTLFAFDRGQGLSEHTAPFDALILIIDGEAEVTISGIIYNLKSGEIITIPTGSSHSLKAVQEFKMILVMIRS